MSSPNLRDAILAALAKLPGTREFHIHVLVSSTRKHTEIFQFALPRPRTYVQDILILASEQKTPDSPRIIVAAVEASVFNVPLTSCAIVYVSKVDSTGFASAPSPVSTIVRALLVYYGNPATRPVAADHIWVQLFARAQGQYLFANSTENPAKRPLSDAKLCGWWKRVLSEVATELESLISPRPPIGLYYNLPGLNELEAFNTVKTTPAPVSSSLTWIYDHPYAQTKIPLPCPMSSDPQAPKNLGHYIPYFDDDPKSRFMDEIAYITDKDGIRSPVRKRSRKESRTQAHEDAEGASNPTALKDSQQSSPSPLGELGRVTPGEFWERMSFRQECVAGAVTGFFTLMLSAPLSATQSDVSRPSPLAPQPGQVSSQINKRVMTSLLTGVEWSTEERAIRATETIEGTIKGLCEGLTAVTTAAPTVLHAPRPRKPTSSHVGESHTPEPSLLAPPPPRTPSPKLAKGKRVLPDVSPNPFPEPVASLETYQSHIYGSVCVSNPLLPSTSEKDVGESRNGSNSKTEQNQHVTVLTARKKKKRAE